MAEDGEEALLNCLSFVKFRFKSGGEEAQLTAVLESIVKRLSAKGHYANLLQALQSATLESQEKIQQWNYFLSHQPQKILKCCGWG